jgi:thiamine monophosphate synthase
MNKRFYKHYIFLDQINEAIKKNLIKLNNANIIIDINEKNKINLDKENSIIKFAKENNIPFFIKNNFSKCLNNNSNGIFIDSKNKKVSRPVLLKKKFLIIGSVHNQIEYMHKIKQKCSILLLSPIFYNKKYSINSILNIVKFNLLSKDWSTELSALGGIDLKNVKKVSLTKAKGVGIKRLIFNI